MPSDPIDTSNTAAQREQSVGTFYDDNTNLFLKLGQHGKSAGIHQPLYTRNGMSVNEAMHTQHDIILRRIRSRNSNMNILDLGCGVGASMLYLAAQTDREVRITGLTISEKQKNRANDLIAKAGLMDRLSVIQASYLDIPRDVQYVDTAYAIESFIHAADPDQFFAEVSRTMQTGSELVLFDDFLRHHGNSEVSHRILEEFRFGWKANALMDIDAVHSMAAKHNLRLIEQTDHTEHLDLWRTRDKLVARIAPVARLFAPHSSYATFLVGGNARQQAFRHNLLSYMQLIFVKQ